MHILIILHDILDFIHDILDLIHCSTIKAIHFLQIIANIFNDKRFFWFYFSIWIYLFSFS